MTDSDTMDGFDARKAFIERLEAHPLVSDVETYRDGYQRVVLELDDPAPGELATCPGCGAVGLRERIEVGGHDCREFLDDETEPE